MPRQSEAFTWYRDESDVVALRERFEAAGIGPDTADRLLRLGLSPEGLTAESWAEVGPLGVALVATEIDRAADVVRQRAAALRSAAVAELAETMSIADIARQLGQTRQAISKAAHGERTLLAWARDLAGRAQQITEDGAL